MAAKLAAAFLIAIAAAPAAHGQPVLTLREAAERRPGDFAPKNVGSEATVTGVVAAPAVRIVEYFHLPVQDGTGAAFTLESHSEILTPFRPGDKVEATGRIQNRAGLPVLDVLTIKKTGITRAPSPRTVTIEELNGFTHLGALVHTEATVVEPGENAGGNILVLRDGSDSTVRVFLPRGPQPPAPLFTHLHAGDRVSVIGIGSQYSPLPPFNDDFQIVVRDASSVVLLRRGWSFSPAWLIGTALGLGIAVAAWWRRERRLASQRRSLRILMNLAEDVVAAATPQEVARLVAATIPVALPSGSTELYLLDRNNNTLEPVRDDARAETAFSINSPLGGLSSAIALCFRNRAMLVVPDTRRSPLFHRDSRNLPGAAVFAPMHYRQEASGVLLIAFPAPREIGKDEQAAIQHVATQIATSLKLQEQKIMREQLIRSEKMAATGQLISGVASELRGPLQEIRSLVRRITNQPGASDTSALAAEAERASTILARVASFGSAEPGQGAPVDLAAILRGLIDLRRSEWEAKRIEWEASLAPDGMSVLGSASQLEQVFLDLLVKAEGAVAGQRERRLALSAVTSGRSAIIGVEFSGPAQAVADQTGGSSALGLQICQAVILNHGGELRVRSVAPAAFRYEIELPLIGSAAPPLGEEDQQAPGPARVMTALIVEPEIAMQRRLMSLLAQRGHRAIPVASAEDGLDLSHRLPFDVAFCALQLPRLNWVEFHHKVKGRIGAFVLLTDGYDATLSKSFEPGQDYLLNRNLQGGELERLLVSIENRQEAAARR